ncbi:adk [Acanthosepion pharaonis]|uniref:Adk n=1 Tax=Acanthosepion pharaonis TaxID=158019 RepID=A0A812CQQ2_ACAPH|nr:adk [Sepia pharaonis]
MDATKRPMSLPPDFANYAETHKLFDMFKFLQEQLLIKQPENPIEFLINLLKMEFKEVLRVIIIGPPASGKSTIAKMISNKLNLVCMNLDNILVDTAAHLQEEAFTYQRERRELPEDLLLKIIIDKIDGAKILCRMRGWVMEGLLKSKSSILQLQQRGIYPSHCIFLKAPDTVLIERAVGKRVDPRDGTIYHTTFDWPANLEIQRNLVTIPGCSEPEMVRQLLKYHRTIDEIIFCFQHITKKINADQPKADIFSQVLSFLSSSPRSMAPHNPRIILLGAIGSGRKTQAELLAKKYQLINVSCSQLIKEAIAKETKMGSVAQTYLDRQMTIPDLAIMNILKERLTRLDCMTCGWVLHGFPRNQVQAEQLEKEGLFPTRVFFLDVPLDTILERVTEKRTDPQTGQQHHLHFNPPLTAEVMKRLCINPKHEPDVVKEKVADYRAYEEELSDFYHENGVHVNADQDYYTVFEIIQSILVHPVVKKFSNKT